MNGTSYHVYTKEMSVMRIRGLRTRTMGGDDAAVMGDLVIRIHISCMSRAVCRRCSKRISCLDFRAAAARAGVY